MLIILSSTIRTWSNLGNILETSVNGEGAINCSEDSENVGDDIADGDLIEANKDDDDDGGEEGEIVVDDGLGIEEKGEGEKGEDEKDEEAIAEGETEIRANLGENDTSGEEREWTIDREGETGGGVECAVELTCGEDLELHKFEEGEKLLWALLW